MSSWVDIVSLENWGDPSSPVPDLLPLLANAKRIEASDPIIAGWAFSPWCSGVIKRSDGTDHDFQLFLGGLLKIELTKEENVFYLLPLGQPTVKLIPNTAAIAIAKTHLVSLGHSKEYDAESGAVINGPSGVVTVVFDQAAPVRARVQQLIVHIDPNTKAVVQTEVV